MTSRSVIFDSTAEIALPVNVSQVLDVMVSSDFAREIDPPVFTVVRMNLECEISSLSLFFPDPNFKIAAPVPLVISVKSVLVTVTGFLDSNAYTPAA